MCYYGSVDAVVVRYPMGKISVVTKSLLRHSWLPAATVTAYQCSGVLGIAVSCTFLASGGGTEASEGCCRTNANSPEEKLVGCALQAKRCVVCPRFF